MSIPRFITIDGIDGVGKSTQIERLADAFRSRGHDVLAVRDPGTTEIGKRLREILLDGEIEMQRRTEAMLFMASRCEMIETVLRPALAEGKTVISDRFLLANVVYQSTHQTEQNPGQNRCNTPDVTPELLWQMGRLACGGLCPDLTLLLDLPAETAFARLGEQTDRMESRGLDYLESVRSAFLEQLPHTGGRGELISAAGTIDDVTTRIHRTVFG